MRTKLIPVPVVNPIRLTIEAESRNLSVQWGKLAALSGRRWSGCSGHELRWQPRSWSFGIRLTYCDGIRRRGQTFSVTDRLIFAGLYRLAATVLNALAIVKPETVIKWHRAGFRSYWRWKSRRHVGLGSLPWICSSCRQSCFVCSMDCWSWDTADDTFCGLASQLTQMDRKSGHGSIWLGTGSPLSHSWSDGAYGGIFIRRLRSMAIRDRPTSARSPWQNAYAEGWSVRSEGNALTTLLCRWATPPSRTAIVH